MSDTGVKKWKNRHILEITRASLIGARMRPLYWENVIMSTVYLFNRVPTSASQFKIPLEMLYGHFTNSFYFDSGTPRVWMHYVC